MISPYTQKVTVLGDANATKEECDILTIETAAHHTKHSTYDFIIFLYNEMNTFKLAKVT